MDVEDFEGWSPLDAGDADHWNCSWKAGSRVFFLTAVFFVFLAEESETSTKGSDEPVRNINQ